MKRAPNRAILVVLGLGLIVSLSLVASCASTDSSSTKAQAKATQTPNSTSASQNGGAAGPVPTPFVPLDQSTGKVSFPSGDGLLISADLYLKHPKTAPFILLMHRAGWSRGEYLEIAPKLNALGFNAMAIDQRSGKTKYNVANKTFEAAIAAAKPVEFTDAIPDLQAAIDYAKNNYASGKFLLLGSSYSSSLGLLMLKENPGKIDAYLAFSPGEYFEKMGKPAPWVAEQASSVTIPVFFTSRRSEYEAGKSIFDKIPSKNKIYYLPDTEGKHGAEALFSTTAEQEGTWIALRQFLAAFAASR